MLGNGHENLGGGIDQSRPNDWVNIDQLAHEYKDELMTRLIKRPSDSGDSNRPGEHKNSWIDQMKLDDLLKEMGQVRGLMPESGEFWVSSFDK